MNSTDLKYINSLATRLRNFRQKGNIFQASCPICGDSKKNKRKARLNFYERDGKTQVYCHNECGGMTLWTFLERFDHSLYAEYSAEKFFNKEKFKAEEIVLRPIKKKKSTYDVEIFDHLCINCADLSDFSAVKHYLVERRIPQEFLHNIFYTSRFKEFTLSLGQEIDGQEEARIIIPFFDEQKKVFAYSARSLDKKSQLRYVNIVLDETKPRLFGLERWNKNKKTFVVEGAFDSMFLPNCLATGGGDIVSALSGLDHDFTVVYDNEPRSQSTRQKIEKAINHGFSVCIWPSIIKEKDINKMVMEGISPKQIEKEICENTFSGLSAKLALASR